MRVITWNLMGAKESSEAWNILSDLQPDIALLQEVIRIPEKIAVSYDIKFQPAIGKNGKSQNFGTAILVKGKIVDELPLSSDYFWVNHELERFKGNLLSCVAQTAQIRKLNLISVYSPAWPVDVSKYPGIDVTPVKLKSNPKIWLTEILWSALKKANLNDIPWIVGGDFNSFITFDASFGSVNREIQERMNELGLTECLRKYNGKPVPTFRNRKDGQVAHQIDHLFVTSDVGSTLGKCTTSDEFIVFGKEISDHLPIVADFN